MTGRRARDPPGWPDADGGCQGWGAPSSASPRGLGPGDARPPPWRVQSLRAELGELPPPRFVKRSPKCLRIAPLRPAGSAMAIKSLSSDSFRPLSCSLSHKSRRACLTRRSTGARGATVNRRRAPPRPGAAGPRPRSRARGVCARRPRAEGGQAAPGTLAGPPKPSAPRPGSEAGVACGKTAAPGAASPWRVATSPTSRPAGCAARSGLQGAGRHRGRSAAARLPREDAGGGAAATPRAPPRPGAGVPRGQALPSSRSELRALSSLYAPVLRRLRRERARAARLTPPHEVHPFRYVWFSFNYFS